MIKNFLISFIVFIGIDYIWLGFLAKNFYKSQIGHLMAEKPNLYAAGIFYIIFVAGLLYFAINPSIENKSLAQALTKGAFFGFIAYATYDLTNQAVLKNWPTIVTVSDILWGAFLAAAVSGITYLIASKI